MFKKNPACFFVIALFVLLQGCQSLNNSEDDTKKAASLLSKNTPNFRPKFFLCEEDKGRYGIWVAPVQPRYTGARAFVSLKEEASKEDYVLFTFQYRVINGVKSLYAEGPAGGFEGPPQEDAELFAIREKLIYENGLLNKELNHEKINKEAKQKRIDIPLDLKKEEWQKLSKERADENSYRTAIREGYEESGVKALILSEEELKKEKVNRKISLLLLQETNNYMVSLYHIQFACSNCLKKTVLTPEQESNEEVEFTKWVPIKDIKRLKPYAYEVSVEGKRYPVKPDNGWNSALEIYLGFAKSNLNDLSHEALMTNATPRS